MFNVKKQTERHRKQNKTNATQLFIEQSLNCL